MAALFTNSVSGLTGRFGRRIVTKAACPGLGMASAVAQAVPTGPSRPPSTVLTCAASAPSPTKLSPISTRDVRFWSCMGASYPAVLAAQAAGVRVPLVTSSISGSRSAGSVPSAWVNGTSSLIIR